MILTSESHPTFVIVDMWWISEIGIRSYDFLPFTTILVACFLLCIFSLCVHSFLFEHCFMFYFVFCFVYPRGMDVNLKFPFCWLLFFALWNCVIGALLSIQQKICWYKPLAHPLFKSNQTNVVLTSKQHSSRLLVHVWT